MAKTKTISKQLAQIIKNRKKNTANVLREFPYQLTVWMDLGEIHTYTEQIRKYEGRNSYGRYYVVKMNKQTHQYAVFTKGKEMVKDVYDLTDLPTEDSKGDDATQLVKSVIETKKYLKTFF